MSKTTIPAAFKKGAVVIRQVGQGKEIEILAKTDILSVGVQYVSADGGETNLHSHAATDQVWLVLDGEATFYASEDDSLEVARLTKNETLLVPRGTPYWFKSSGAQSLVILRLGAKVPGVEDKRTNFTARQREAQVIS